MCRYIKFAGTCTTCGDSYTWEDLCQQLSCLEAKNNDSFGDCSTGINVEDHAFDQECDRCSNVDEGVGDMDSGTLEWKRSGDVAGVVSKKQRT